jgi:hypothetical protein
MGYPQTLGNVTADSIIIEAHFGMADPTMPGAGGEDVAVAKQL